MTKAEAVTVVTQLMLAYPREGNPDVLELYADHLRDLDRTDVLRAVHHLIREARWLPTVAELRETTRALRPRPTPPILLAPPKPAPAPEVQQRVKGLVDDLLATWGRPR